MSRNDLFRLVGVLYSLGPSNPDSNGHYHANFEIQLGKLEERHACQLNNVPVTREQYERYAHMLKKVKEDKTLHEPYIFASILIDTSIEEKLPF